MSDSIQQAFRNLSVQSGNSSSGGSSSRGGYERGSQQYTTPPRQSSSSGSGPLQSPRSLHGAGDVPPQPFFGSSSSGSSSAGGNGVKADASAAARFERFFPTSPGAATTQHAGLSPAGRGANTAFGSFGRSIGSSSIGSGHFGSSGGVRRTPSRAAIPAQWSAEDTVISSSSGEVQAYTPAHESYGSLAATSPDDDVIPTAIVVKNIPFSVKREQLLQIIEDLACPMPYAFNYHCDQGVFRGLAFANFKEPEEADQVVAALNGFDVSGRKLRVEYKKVLQAGEKERIEKEKAIKRMHSMQLEKERERARQEEYASNAYLMPGYPGQFANSDAYLAHQQQQQQQQLGRDPPSGIRSVLSSSKLSANAAVDNAATYGSGKREELDLNDASTLEIYSRVLLFRDDRMRDELSFSRSLTPSERRTVHLVAQKLGLYHYSTGEGEERCVVVSKNERAVPTRSVRSQASSIGRSHRGPPIDALESAIGGNAATTGRVGLLRLKKSAPNMMYDTEEDAASFYGGGANGYLNPVTGSLAGRKSNQDLRQGYSATVGRRPQPGGIGGAAGLQSLFASPFDVPPVPSLPGASSIADEYNMSPSTSATQLAHFVRQPRGPPTPMTGGSPGTGAVDARTNFALRSRVPTAASAATNTSEHTAHIDTSNSPSKLRYLPASSSTNSMLTDSDVTTHSTLEI